MAEKIKFDYKKSQIDYASQLHHEGGLANLQAACNIYSTHGYSISEISMEIAQEKENLLDYDGAISGFEELGLYDDAKRVRRKKLDEKKYKIINLDINFICQTPNINKYINKMKKNICKNLNISNKSISIKATTNEKIGLIGKGEGIAAESVVSIVNV